MPDSIKVYQNVHKEDPEKNFGISRMEDIYIKHNGEPDTPHRHDYYTILLVQKARGKHIIDFQEYDLNPNEAFFISPGQVHQVIEYEQSFGFSMVFSNQFLIENNIPQSFINDLNLFNDYGVAPPLPLAADQLDQLTEYCEQMFTYYHSDKKLRKQAIGAYLKLFLILCNNTCTLTDDNLQQVEAGNSLLRNFKELVDLHYQEWHSSTQYADALNITADHLNRTVKSLIGRTAKEYIQTKLHTEARRMLYFSDLSTKEIGYNLGFSESSHFSAFFKKCDGNSPSEFRKNR